MPIGRTPALAALAALGIAACGATEAASPDSTLPAPPVTVGGVGVVPDTVAGDQRPITVIPRPVDEDGNEIQLIGEQVDGNRFLAIGDSIFAGTSTRYGGQMCDVLVPLGWTVAVEAEPSRSVEFGNLVLDEMLDPFSPDGEWDVAAVFLGSNYRGDPVEYEAELREILTRLSPRPTILVTVSLYRSDYVEVNEVINRLADEFSFVSVVDWTTLSEEPGILSGDRLHPSDRGRQVLVESIAAELGPRLGVGECLGSEFRDDSAIAPGGSIGGGGSSSGSSSGGSSSGSSSGSSGGSSSGGSSSGSSGNSGSGSSGGVTTTPPAGTVAPDPGDTGSGDGGDTGDGSSGGGDTGDGSSGGGDTGGDTGGGSGGDSGGDTGGGDTGGGDTGGGADTGGGTGGDTGGGSSGGDTGGGSGGDTGGGSGGGADTGGGDTGGGSTGGGSTGGGSTGGGSTGGGTGGGSGGGGSSGGGETGGTTP